MSTPNAFRVTEWQRDAACARPGIDPEMFFPTSTDRAYAYAALSLCSRCPVRAECLEWALTVEDGTGPRVGVVGGMTPHERAQAAAARNRARGVAA